MATIEDKEFGTIVVRRSSRASHIRISVAPNGTLRASLPIYAPLFSLKRMLSSSREQIRSLLESQRPVYDFHQGMQIGKSHTLIARAAAGSVTRIYRHKQQIIAELANSDTLEMDAVQKEIREVAMQALRIEAKSYLPKRLAYLASQLDCRYERVRFSHASGRWGSCSSSGTISLNIALMKLPHELIDYVIIHELCHTKQMNHSTEFWKLVASEDPHYKLHRASLKSHTPTI